MVKKFSLFSSLLVIVFSFFLYRVISLVYYSHGYYISEYKRLTENYTTGGSAPRGRILDINGKVIVDNIGTPQIVYHKIENITLKKELEIASKLVVLTNYRYSYKEGQLKKFYMVLYPDNCNKLITDKEREKYKRREISKKELEALKLDRIPEEMIEELTPLEKYSSYFYYLIYR